MKVKRLIEPNVFYKAEAFHIASKLLYEADSLNGRGGPFIVNAAFSLELYLKSTLSTTIFENGKTLLMVLCNMIVFILKVNIMETVII